MSTLVSRDTAPARGSSRAGHARLGGMQPVIVIGAHRSGTSLTMRLLRDAGLFIGEWRDRNDEAVFFQHLNDWVVRQSGGAWDRPDAVHDLLGNDPLRGMVVAYLGHVLATPRVASYLGWRRYLRHRTPPAMGQPWGWKDPRTTFTLPLWLEIFPDARVIHVSRHGVDVAHSLKTRQDRSIAGTDAGQGGSVAAVAGRRRGTSRVRAWMRSRWIALSPYVDMPLHWRFANSVRCASLEGAFSLWEEYMVEAHAHVSRLGDQVLTLRYEDLLAEPERGLREMAAFAGLPAPAGRLEAAAGAVRAERAYAYRQRADLRAFAQTVESRLAAHGYSA